MPNDHVLTCLYVLASVCVVYKLAYLIRQAASIRTMPIRVMRIAAVLAGTAIVWRTIEVTEGKIAPQPFDLLMQVIWCVILYLFISVLGRKKRVW